MEEMNEEKQAIDEMAEVIKHTERLARDVVGANPSARMIATDLYNKGYRRQVEGEWKDLLIPKDLYACSLCDNRILGAKTNFCPNCGAKMKGGAE
jgi:rubrerythrin